MLQNALEIAREFEYAPFGDSRLVERLPKVASLLTANPEKSIWASCETLANAKSTYRFMDNAKVTHEKCLIPHRRETLKRIEGHQEVLIIQDTTSLDYSTLRSADLGLYSSSPHAKGILVHSSLAVAIGVPMGLVAQLIWSRPPEERGKKHQRTNLPPEQKESHKWVEALHQSIKNLPEGTKAIFVCDREADIYGFMREASLSGHHFLIRAVQNRRVEHETLLQDQVRSQSVAGRCCVNVPRRPGRDPRKAWLEIKFASVTILPPKNGDQSLPKLKLFSVLVTEPLPPKGEKPVEWLLLTDLPVYSPEDALAMVDRYRQRWLIERFHYSLKSGCQVESLQLESFDRLANAIAIYSVIAWKLTWLLYQSRTTPDAPCDFALSRMEWQIAYCLLNKGAKPPTQPPTASEAIQMVARLGGFKARKGDGNPGLKTLWWGMNKLTIACETAQALLSSQMV